MPTLFFTTSRGDVLNIHGVSSVSHHSIRMLNGDEFYINSEYSDVYDRAHDYQRILRVMRQQGLLENVI